MKINILLILTVLFTVQLTKGQVLLNDNFDNYTVGNLGTDFTGSTPGQGGWYIKAYNQSNNHFKIVSEPGRGKVMELITPQSQNINSNALQKRGIDNLWNSRTLGNDVLKIEYDFFTGPPINGGVYALYMSINNDNSLYRNATNSIAQIGYQANGRGLGVSANLVHNSFYYISTQQLSALTDNTWVRLVMYIDYNNQKIYFNLPSTGVLMVHDAPNDISPVNSLLFMAATTGLTPSFLSFYKFDNIIISAVDTVPLSTQDFISSKFNVFPNPANNVVVITNSENMLVNQVTICDITGKQLSTQNFNNEAQIQLNVENLASGTYMLHLKTNEGIAVKKLVKN